jgi:hypothetical protein
VLARAQTAPASWLPTVRHHNGRPAGGKKIKRETSAIGARVARHEYHIAQPTGAHPATGDRPGHLDFGRWFVAVDPHQPFRPHGGPLALAEPGTGERIARTRGSKPAAGLGAITVLLVGVLILVLFLSALLKLEAGPLIIVIFCVGQLSLIGSMLAFIRDMNLSLKAVRLEIEH